MTMDGDRSVPAVQGRTVSLHFVNAITPSVDFFVDGDHLITGRWVISPRAWGGVVPWQEARDARAEGDLPGGACGSVRIRIGTMSSVSMLNFCSRINEQQSNIDGSQTKFIYDSVTGLFFTAAVSAASSGANYAVTLHISGGAEASRLLDSDLAPPDSFTPRKGDLMQSASIHRAAPILGASAIQTRVHIANWIDKDTTVLLQDPRLLQGQWVGEAPNNFSQVGWQEQQEYLAEGALPRGVDGSLSVRNSGSPTTARLVFKRNINEIRASFDGREATPGNPYVGTWDGQKVTLTVLNAGNLMDVTLNIGNQQP